MNIEDHTCVCVYGMTKLVNFNNCVKLVNFNNCVKLVNFNNCVKCNDDVDRESLNPSANMCHTVIHYFTLTRDPYL